MKKLAIVPWGSVFQDDQIFNLDNNILNRDGCLKIYCDIRSCLRKKGWETHTIDYYSDLSEVDWILFFYFDHSQYLNILEKGLLNKCVYYAFEPPVVDNHHSEQGIRRLLKFFPYIMTWNDALVDNKRIFKFMYPYNFNVEWSTVPFSCRKLLVNISGNKYSQHNRELYSERERVVSFFDNSTEFELYGTNWNKEVHHSYKGLANKKSIVYHNFKFALCLENMWDIDGYVTEKILDCFCSGTIPIYWGAKNIDEYIPSECYIPYTKFDNLEEMYFFLNKMTEDEYEVYLKNISLFLQSSNIKVFSAETFADGVIKIIENNNSNCVHGDSKLKLRVMLLFDIFKDKLERINAKIIKWLTHK